MFRTKRISIMLILVVCLCNAARAQDHARLGSEAFGQGDWGEAVEHYTQALEAKPSFGLYVNLGHCYTRLERWAEAASAYEAAMKLDSESATGQIWRFLAQAQYNAGEFPEAMEAFFEAGLLKADGRDDIWIARCMIELEQWVQSRSVLLGHLRRNPTDTEALELLAYVIGQQGDWPGVIEVYRQLLIAVPGRTEYRVALANALAANGRDQQAIDTLEFARRVDRKLTERTNRLLADLYLAEAMPREAAACYARLIAISDKPSADDYYRLGITYFRTEELTSAESAFAKMLKAGSGDHRPEMYLGHIAAKRGDSEKARLHYSAAADKNPTAAEAFVALANLKMKNGQYNDAAAHFAKAIELGDNRAVVQYNHVLALIRQGDMAQTIAALKTAIAEHPSDKGLLRLLDQCVENAGR